MATGPSPLAEALVGLLLPAACREEVLGDMHERYQTQTHYLFSATRTIPYLLVSHARRAISRRVLRAHGRCRSCRVTIQSVTMNALLCVGLVFSAVALQVAVVNRGRRWPALAFLAVSSVWFCAWTIGTASHRLRQSILTRTIMLDDDLSR